MGRPWRQWPALATMGNLIGLVWDLPRLWSGLEAVVLTGAAVIGVDLAADDDIAKLDVGPQTAGDSDEERGDRGELRHRSLCENRGWMISLTDEGQRDLAVTLVDPTDFETGAGRVPVHLHAGQPLPDRFVLKVQRREDHDETTVPAHAVSLPAGLVIGGCSVVRGPARNSLAGRPLSVFRLGPAGMMKPSTLCTFR